MSRCPFLRPFSAAYSSFDTSCAPKVSSLPPFPPAKRVSESVRLLYSLAKSIRFTHCFLHHQLSDRSVLHQKPSLCPNSLHSWIIPLRCVDKFPHQQPPSLSGGHHRKGESAASIPRGTEGRGGGGGKVDKTGRGSRKAGGHCPGRR